MDKCSNSSNAFFFILVQGVKKLTQTEGGSPGAPEIRFLYEVGINKFVQNVADLMHDPNDMVSKKGVIGGYIDDLYWAV